jgi:hypothetical protein
MPLNFIAHPELPGLAVFACAAWLLGNRGAPLRLSPSTPEALTAGSNSFTGWNYHGNHAVTGVYLLYFLAHLRNLAGKFMA